MRIYFSGGRGLVCTPEVLVPERKPHIMLTFHDIKSKDTRNRLKVYTQRVQFEKQTKGAYTETVFMDSGAFTLFNQHVVGGKQKVVRKIKSVLSERNWEYRAKEQVEEMQKRHHLPLPSKKVFRGKGDYSFFDLRQGSEFRQYCDRYASFIKRFGPLPVLATNVDAIMHPDKTWKVQQYFEKEHGVFPIPVLHGLTPLRYLERYLETGKYEVIGFGGLGHAVNVNSYVKWADAMFRIVCPKSKKCLPQVKVHGFAMTSWKLIERWPWWSVDSATWVKLSAYGWLYVPPWSERTGWRFDRPPIQINVSFGKFENTRTLAQFLDVEPENHSPLGRKRNKHMDNVPDSTRDLVLRWLERCGVQEGTVDDAGRMKDFGIRSHFRARSIANLHYLKDLEESRPKWPYPLDHEVVDGQQTDYGIGFGLKH